MSKIEKNIRDSISNSPSFRGDFSSVLSKVNAETSASNFAVLTPLAKRRRNIRIIGFSALSAIGVASLVVSSITTPILIKHYIAYNVTRYSADTNHDVFYGRYSCISLAIVGLEEAKAEDIYFETSKNAAYPEKGIMHLEEDLFVRWFGPFFAEATFDEFSKDGALYVGGVTMDDAHYYCDIIFREINGEGSANVNFASETDPVGGLFNFTF